MGLETHVDAPGAFCEACRAEMKGQQFLLFHGALGGESISQVLLLLLQRTLMDDIE